MLAQITGNRRVDRLYVQLLYQCNFRCVHCFHGEKLADSSQLDIDEFKSLVTHFSDVYQTREVVLLGGEPFLYPNIDAAIQFVHDLGLTVEICTNGHKFTQPVIIRNASQIDMLRISIDGLQSAHDRTRQRGSFVHASETLRLASKAGMRIGVTVTVTAWNVDDIPQLAELAAAHGAKEMKLHQLRLVGNAAHRPELLLNQDDPRLLRMVTWAKGSELPLKVLYDSDLDGGTAESPAVGDTLDRIELDPELGLTISCKAVGSDAHAFRWNPATSDVIYQPSLRDELSLGTPQVEYR